MREGDAPPLDPPNHADASPGPSAEPALAQERGRATQVLWVATMLAIVSGVEVRLLPVLRTDFPLNDGGFLATQIADLRAAHFMLPSLSTYLGRADGTGLPFVQPPLPLYLTALITQLGPIDTTAALRILPAVFALLTLMAFWWLARTYLHSRAAITIALVSFAVLPNAYGHLVTGGGLTRAPGMLCALLALSFGLHLLHQGQGRQVMVVAALAALAGLCDLGAGWWLALSIVVYALAARAEPGALQDLALAGLGALLVSAPWWAERMLSHGVGWLLQPWWGGSILYAAVHLPHPLSYFGVVGVLSGLVGATWLCATGDRRGVIVGWLLITVLLAPDLILHSAPVLCLGLGMAIGDLLLPTIMAARTDAQPVPPTHPLDLTTGVTPQAGAADEETAPGPTELRPPLPPPARFGWRQPGFMMLLADTLTLVVLLLFTGGTVALSWRSEQAGLQAIAPGERAAMQAAGRQAGPGSTFLVITGAPAAFDRVGEWFATISGRANLVSPQPLPWLAGGRFTSRIEAHTRLQSCAHQDVICLDQWERDARASFSHIYVARQQPERAFSREPDRRRDADCCDRVRAALRADSRYAVVYDGPTATIFARVAGSATAAPDPGTR